MVQGWKSSRRFVRFALLAVGFTIAGALAVGGSSAITPTSTASDLAAAIAADASVVSGASFVTVPPTGTPNAVSTTALTGFPTDGASYAILTSGDATLADQPNTDGASGADDGGGNIRGDSDFDVSILKIDLSVPSGINCLSFDFRFLSEEFPEFVGSAFNDAFIAELDSSTWTTSGSTITAPNNFAFDPNGDVISINSTGATAMTAADATGTTYDGATPLLSASSPITSGAHSLYLSIFDQGDPVLDSAAFVDNLILGTTAAGGCKSGATVVSLAKTADSASAVAGTADGYTITATNPSGSPVTLSSISDVLPAGFSYVSGSTTGATTSDPSISSQTLTWTGSFVVPANGTLTLHFNVTTSSTPGDYFNNASAVASSTAVSPTGPTAKITVTAPPSADLSIAKGDAPDPVTAGQQLTYTLTVHNGGPDAAAGVGVSDVLPAGATFVSATPSQGSCSGTGTVSCALGGLANGGSATVTIVVTASGSSLSNTATVSATTADPVSANNSATATTTVNPPAASADLSIAKGDAPDPVTAGQQLTYTLTVHNGGPDAAAGVSVSDVLPAGATFVSATPSQGSCSGTGTVSCALGGLANGGSATVTIVVTASGSSLSNTATVSATTADPVSANNSATATTTVNPPAASADLSIAKGDAPDPVTAGQQLTYTLTVHNGGPDAAAGVGVSDVLPAGATFVSATPSQGSCSGTGTVSCALGGLANGGSATVTIVVTASGSSLSNTATVSATTADPVSANNSATATTTVNPPAASADLSIAKGDAPDPVTAGQQLTYTLTVHNGGPDAAAGVGVSDVLPVGATFVSATPSQGSCSGTGTVSCALGGLANGGSATVTIVVTASGSSLSNTATVSATTADPVSANNSATATTTVNPPAASADLSIAKGDAPDPVTAGQQLTYTLTVHNGGPDAAAGVGVSDVLPVGATFVSATPSQGSCSGTGTVSCALGGLANGGSATVTIVVTASGSSLSNTATVSATTADPVSANNSATATTTVNPPAASADLSIAKGDAPDPVTAGQQLTYTLTVHNGGPDAAAGVSVSDVLPAGATFVSATPSQGSCSGTGTVSCALGGLANGGSATVTIVVTASGSSLSNTATVSATTADPVSANNSATATTTVNPANQPPNCSSVVADPATLWPPDHKLRLVTLTGGSDPDHDPLTITITGVTQDEPVGNKAPDAEAGSTPNQVWLRAERMGNGDGRTYAIAFTLADGRGGTCTGTVTVTVPHDQSATSDGHLFRVLTGLGPRNHFESFAHFERRADRSRAVG